MSDWEGLVTAEPDELHDDPAFEKALLRVFEEGLAQGLAQGPVAELGPYHDESAKTYIEREFTLDDFARWFGVQRLGALPYNGVGFHHTYRPVPANWNGIASLHAIFTYYNTEYEWPWGLGPHLFLYSGQGKYRAGIPHIYVARHPAHDGAGIKYRNRRWIHLECIWDGDNGPFSDVLTRAAAKVLAIICSRHPYADREIPLEFVKGGVDNPSRPLGLMYHRDQNPEWQPGAWPKSCPGLKVSHENLDPDLLRNAHEHFPWSWSVYPGGADFVAEIGSLVAGQGAIARFQPSRQGSLALNLVKGQGYPTAGYTDLGEQVNGSSRWYVLSDEDYRWVHSSGGTYSRK
jgi:hypothetical protein